MSRSRVSRPITFISPTSIPSAAGYDAIDGDRTAVRALGTETRCASRRRQSRTNHQIEGVHFRVVGISKKKGGFLGTSFDSFAVIPLGAYMKLFGARPSLALSVKPVTPALLPIAMDDATVALRVARHLKGSQQNNFGLVTSDTVLALYHQANGGLRPSSSRRVRSRRVAGIVIMNIML